MTGDAKEAVDAYIRHYLDVRVSKGASYRSLAPEFGCSHVMLHQIHTGSGGVGPKLEASAAAMLHGGSIDALRKAAFDYVAAHPESIRKPVANWDEFSQRYPTGARVYEEIKGSLHPDVQADAIVALHYPGDPPADVWRTNYFALSDMARKRAEERTASQPDEEAAKLDALHKTKKKKPTRA